MKNFYAIIGFIEEFWCVFEGVNEKIDAFLDEMKRAKPRAGSVAINNKYAHESDAVFVPRCPVTLTAPP